MTYLFESLKYLCVVEILNSIPFCLLIMIRISIFLKDEVLRIVWRKARVMTERLVKRLLTDTKRANVHVLGIK